MLWGPFPFFACLILLFGSRGLSLNLSLNLHGL
jgi:hypothetical protein